MPEDGLLLAAPSLTAGVALTLPLYVPPGPALAPYVAYFVLVDLQAHGNQLPASPFPMLFFHGQPHGIRYQEDGLGPFLPQAMLSGPTLRSRRSQSIQADWMLAVAFHAGQISRLFDIQADLLTDQLLPLEGVLGVAQTALWLEALCEAKGALERLLVLQDRLIAQLELRFAQQRLSPLDQLGARALNQPLLQLARDCGWSLRQFERRFQQQFGLAPERYRQLARFTRVLGLLMQQRGHGPTLAQLAQAAGYADQAHFTRDFSQFCGTTPGRFRQQLAQDPAFWAFRMPSTQTQDIMNRVRFHRHQA
ncbi:helix-turn-helix domain-containing protein [Leeia aquatica]|uniref:AraC family transcriptional regulator n=1 Tax=Leeia aquatica TaxID=2725557 RepID=A0A847S7N6_9NEIS|nr:helix-turn-helix domain-containing protein [Leeia aquatica]NLR75027.1 AraC family transcriptional regulator [Leeia aquatica]